MTAFSSEIYEAIEKETQMTYNPTEDYTKSGHEDGDIAIAKEIANAHVNWFMNMVAPLMENYFVHGFKHGVEHQKEKYAKIKQEVEYETRQAKS